MLSKMINTRNNSVNIKLDKTTLICRLGKEEIALDITRKCLSLREDIMI